MRIPATPPVTGRGQAWPGHPRLKVASRSAAAVFGVEIWQHALAHQLDDPHHLGGFHARPAEAEDQVVRLEPPDALLDLPDRLVRRAEDEAVAGQFVETDPEIFVAGQCLVLAPF